MKYIIEDPSFNPENNVLEIKEGHTVFLVGPNSVGKSTLLESLRFDWWNETKMSMSVTFTLTKEKLIEAIYKVVRRKSDDIIKKVVADFKDTEITLKSKGNKIIKDDFHFIKKYLSEIEKISKAVNASQTESLFKRIKTEEEAFISAFKKQTLILEDKKIKEYKKITINNFDINREGRYYRSDTMDNPLSDINAVLHHLKRKQTDYISIFKKYDGTKVFAWENKRTIDENDRFITENKDFLSKDFVDEIIKTSSNRLELINDMDKINVYNFNDRDFDNVILNIKGIYKIGFFLERKDDYERLRRVSDINQEIKEEVESELDIKLFREKNKNDGRFEYAINSMDEKIIDLSDGQIKQILNIQIEHKNSVEKMSWDEPFTSLDYEKLDDRRNKILNNGKTNIISTHKFSAIFPSNSEDVYIFFIDENKKRNLIRLIEILELKEIPKSINKIIPKLFGELFAAQPKNLVVEGKDDKQMILNAYKIIGRKTDINFIVLNGVTKLNYFIDMFNYTSDFLGTKTRILLDNDDEAKKAMDRHQNKGIFEKLTKEIFSKFEDVPSFEKIFLNYSGKDKKRELIDNFLEKTTHSKKDILKSKIICDIIDESFA